METLNIVYLEVSSAVHLSLNRCNCTNTLTLQIVINKPLRELNQVTRSSAVCNNIMWVGGSPTCHNLLDLSSSSLSRTQTITLTWSRKTDSRSLLLLQTRTDGHYLSSRGPVRSNWIKCCEWRDKVSRYIETDIPCDTVSQGDKVQKERCSWI